MIYFVIHLFLVFVCFIMLRNQFIKEDFWTNGVMIAVLFGSLLPVLNIVFIGMVVYEMIDDSGWFKEDGF